MYHHHSTADSMKNNILERIETFKIKDDGIVVVSGKKRTRKPKNAIDPNAIHTEYDSYVWNRYGEGNNHMSKSLLGKLWRHGEFETIYDVPLDGTYIFQAYDAGERGCGSFGRITAIKVDEAPKVPFVDPGAIGGITAQ